MALDSVAETRTPSIPNRNRMPDSLAPDAPPQQPPYRMAALVVIGTLLL